MQINLTNIFRDNLQNVQIEKKLLINNVNFSYDKADIKDGIIIHLNIDKISNKDFIIKGYIKSDLILNCYRCNDEAVYNLDGKFLKEIKIDIVEDEEIFMDGYNLDLEKLALNELYLNFPMKVLCDENCKGICKNCGTNLNFHICNCDNEDIDPRFAGLKDLFYENFKEV